MEYKKGSGDIEKEERKGECNLGERGIHGQQDSNIVVNRQGQSTTERGCF